MNTSQAKPATPAAEPDLAPLGERLRKRRKELKLTLQEVADKAPVVLDRTHEYCSFILNAIETDTPFRFNGNVTNHGVISNLPSNALVEVPILADGAGLHACYVGALPPELAALNRTNLNVQEVVVEALKRQDRELVYRAVQLDPLTSAVCTLDDARRMVDELFAAHEAHLTF